MINVLEAAVSVIVGAETFTEVVDGRSIDDLMWLTAFALVLVAEDVILVVTASETRAHTR